MDTSELDPQSSPFEFRSADERFGVRIGPAILQRLLAFCDAAGDDETGGVLLGRYSPKHEWATVSKATGPTPDSRSGRTWYWRGVAGLQDLVDKHWTKSHTHYLGEWHYHPGASPVSSDIDDASMHGISCSPEYNCPEPVLLIVGSGLGSERAISAHVYPQGGSKVILHRYVAPIANSNA